MKKTPMEMQNNLNDAANKQKEVKYYLFSEGCC